VRILSSHLVKVLASTIWIWIGPDQSQRGHGNIPVVIALRSISAKFTVLPHLGQIWALTHCFSEFIKAAQSKCCNRSVCFLNPILLLPMRFMNHMEVVFNNHPSACLLGSACAIESGYPCQPNITAGYWQGGILDCFRYADLSLLIGPLMSDSAI
jgi:hypothetical protein